MRPDNVGKSSMLWGFTCGGFPQDGTVSYHGCTARGHVLVPPHEIVPEEQHAPLLEKLMITSKIHLPIIRFHTDMQARWLGLVPGDIIKITRPSPSAGVYEVYRVCAP